MPPLFFFSFTFVCAVFNACRYGTREGQELVLIGDHPALGRWNPGEGVRMTWSSGHVWTAEVELPCTSAFFYKYVALATFSPDLSLSFFRRMKFGDQEERERSCQMMGGQWLTHFPLFEK